MPDIAHTTSKLGSRTRSLLMVVAIAISVSACKSPPAHVEARLSPTDLEYERVHPKLRKLLHMNPGNTVESCGNLVFAGPIKTNTELDDVVVSDGQANYYDNRSDRLVAICDFWTCSRHNAYCNRSCPPREWKCTSYIP